MALFPCDFDLKRYQGAQQTMYPAIVNRSESNRRRLRLCPLHFADYLSDLETHAQDAYDETDSNQLLRCQQCHEPVLDTQHQFFVTVYAKGDERADFWAPVHDECVGPLRVRWCLPLDMA
jgi:hypothetical protein